MGELLVVNFKEFGGNRMFYMAVLCNWHYVYLYGKISILFIEAVACCLSNTKLYITVTP